MSRYRSDYDDDRELYAREERMRREAPRHSDYSYRDQQSFETERRPDYSNRGRYGERAEYDYDEPRYSERRERYRGDDRRSSLFDIRGDLSRGNRAYAPERSRLRCRDIMTRDLAVANRDTPLTQTARMMKQEDTGVIPVVEYDTNAGNGKAANADERNYDTRNYSRGRLVGLITDRDIAVRAVAEAKDCGATRAEDIMSTDIHTARPNDRVVDVIRKMADKQVRRIPVVNEGGYLAGMISMADIATETHDDAELADALEEISKGTSFWNRIFG
jgi:CBS domain-containing protein